MVCATRPKVGTCEEWRIENETEDLHPFHLHENSFQLIAINDKPVNPVEIWDTFGIPQKLNGVNGSLTIRVRFKQWYGKTVFHCHALPHEDTGMMQNILMSSGAVARLLPTGVRAAVPRGTLENKCAR
jgi:FtsP/CotA-like multicopper oxidase with cupredoxin domain